MRTASFARGPLAQSGNPLAAFAAVAAVAAVVAAVVVAVVAVVVVVVVVGRLKPPASSRSFQWQRAREFMNLTRFLATHCTFDLEIGAARPDRAHRRRRRRRFCRLKPLVARTNNERQRRRRRQKHAALNATRSFLSRLGGSSSCRLVSCWRLSTTVFFALLPLLTSVGSFQRHARSGATSKAADENGQRTWLLGALISAAIGAGRLEEKKEKGSLCELGARALNDRHCFARGHSASRAFDDTVATATAVVVALHVSAASLFWVRSAAH